MTQVPNSSLQAAPYHDFYSALASYDQILVSLIAPLVRIPIRSIVDLACGVGFSTRSLRAAFPEARITATDVDSGMVKLAQRDNTDANTTFATQSAIETINGCDPNSIDIVFVKSAYHYFERELPVERVKPVLSKDGLFVVAERTSRSARSYPMPDIAQRYWADYFSESRCKTRNCDAENDRHRLQVSCYGQHVDIPRDCYFSAVRDRQLFGLASLSDSVIDQWVTTNQDNPLYSTTVPVYEEFWIYAFGRKA